MQMCSATQLSVTSWVAASEYRDEYDQGHHQETPTSRFDFALKEP